MATYICQPAFTRLPPAIMGKSYEEARIILLEHGWEPVQKSFGAYPETEWCGNEKGKESCRFIFRDPPHGYALVITTEGRDGQLELRVTEHSFRCRI